MSRYLGAFCIIIAGVLWGIDPILLRPHLSHLIGFVPLVVLLEHAVAFAFMLPFMFVQRKLIIKEIRSLGAKELGSFLWIAAFGGVIGTVAIVKALFLVQFNHLSVIVILQKLQPLFAILLAIIVLKEKPAKGFYIWALLGLLGSYLLTFGLHKPVFEGNVLLKAAAYSLLAAFAFGSATVFGKSALKKTSFSVATYIRFGLTSLLLLSVVGAQGFAGMTQVSSADLATIIVIAFSSGGLAIFIYYFGLKQVPASKSTIYELSLPITAVCLDMLINRSFLSLPQYLGASLVLLSMLMVTWTRVAEKSQ